MSNIDKFKEFIEEILESTRNDNPITKQQKELYEQRLYSFIPISIEYINWAMNLLCNPIIYSNQVGDIKSLSNTSCILHYYNIIEILIRFHGNKTEYFKSLNLLGNEDLVYMIINNSKFPEIYHDFEFISNKYVLIENMIQICMNQNKDDKNIEYSSLNKISKSYMGTNLYKSINKFINRDISQIICTYILGKIKK